MADLGRGEAARGEEVGEVGRQPHLRDQLVRHGCRWTGELAGRGGEESADLRRITEMRDFEIFSSICAYRFCLPLQKF